MLCKIRANLCQKRPKALEREEIAAGRNLLRSIVANNSKGKYEIDQKRVMHLPVLYKHRDLNSASFTRF